MHITISTLQNALAYATFPHPEMRKEVTKYLEVLGGDLDEADYSPAAGMDEAVSELNEVMSEIDQAREALDEALSNVDFNKSSEVDN